MIKKSVDKSSYKIALVVLIFTVIVVGSIIYFNPTSFGSSISSPNTTSTTTIITTTSTTSNNTISTVCIVNVEGAGTYLHVVSDSTQQPLSEISVHVVPTATSCFGFSRPSPATYSTNTSGWIYIEGMQANYYFEASLVYTGRNYNFSLPQGPLDITYATLSLPSGNLSITLCYTLATTNPCRTYIESTNTSTSTLTTTSAPVHAGPLTVVSVSLLKPYNPGGPTIEVILQNNATDPVVSLQTVLHLSGRNYTYVFDDVSLSNPLLPNQDASQTATLIGAGFNTNQMYSMEIRCTLQNGSLFDFVTPVTIAQYPNQPVAYGGNGNLQLTMVLGKTAYSLGEPVNLTLTITNISNQTINFMHTGLDFNFRVYNGTNNIVYQWSNFKAIAQFIIIVPLQAGESRSANFTWLQTCNFNASVEGDPVSPGTYNIFGQTGPTYGIQTTPIQLTIVKPN